MLAYHILFSITSKINNFSNYWHLLKQNNFKKILQNSVSQSIAHTICLSRCIRQIFNEDAIALCGVIHENMGGTTMPTEGRLITASTRERKSSIAR